jgi:hypothetical protein
MTEELKQKIKKEMNVLPKELQDAINAVDWIVILDEIGKKYLLSDSEIIDLQIETATLLVGYTNPNLFASDIESNIGTTKDTAEKIENEILEKILNPISKKITENIKKNLKENTITWKQNINFVVSGGDYTVFLKKENLTEKMVDKPIPEKTPVNYSKIEDLKNKFTI